MINLVNYLVVAYSGIVQNAWISQKQQMSNINMKSNINMNVCTDHPSIKTIEVILVKTLLIKDSCLCAFPLKATPTNKTY